MASLDATAVARSDGDSDEPLIRGLGPLAALMLVAGAVIGTGIFVSPSIVARSSARSPS